MLEEAKACTSAVNERFAKDRYDVEGEIEARDEDTEGEWEARSGLEVEGETGVVAPVKSSWSRDSSSTGSSSEAACNAAGSSVN